MNRLASPHWAGVVHALLHTLWQGGIIAGLLALALRRMNNPVARYRCLLASLAGVMLTGLVTWAVLDRPVHPTATNSPAPQGERGPAPPLETARTVAAAHVAASTASPAQLPCTAWLALAWITGAMIMLGRSGIQIAGAGRLRRLSIPVRDARVLRLLEEARRAVGLARRVRIAAIDKMISPAVVGVVAPTLIFPLSLMTTLSPEQIRFVLLHELAHVRRGDYFANLFQMLAEALLFFNPAVWWISRQLRIEREACCDLLAVELSGAPAEYARALVRVAEQVLSPTPAAAPAFGEQRGSPSLADRVKRLLVPGYRPKLRLTWSAILTGLLGSVGLLLLSAVGARITVAAILSPEERIAKIEQKMTEYGEKPEVEGGSGKDEERATIRVIVRTKDGLPLPNQKLVMIHSFNRRASAQYSTGMEKDGSATKRVHPGQTWIEADIEGYAPALAGPFDTTATNWIDAGSLVVDRGFEVAALVMDANSGQAVTNGSLRAQFVMRDGGTYLQRAYNERLAAGGRVTFSNCLDQAVIVTVNASGYEISDQRFERLSPGQRLEVKLRPGAVVSGAVTDKNTGQAIQGATIHILFESGPTVSNYEWTDALRLVAVTDASGRFSANQLRRGTRYWLGVSAAAHESVLVAGVLPGVEELTVKLGRELVVRGHVIGSLEGLQRRYEDPTLYASYQEVFENHSLGRGEWIPLRVTNGAATFQFTNRVSARVWLAGGNYREEREVTAPIDDWVVDLTKAPKPEGKVEAKLVPKREVVFRFKDASGTPPSGAVSVTIPDDLDKAHLTAHMDELVIKNGEVRAKIAIGGRTSIEPKRMAGFWFNRAGERGSLLSIEVTNGHGPMVIEIPLVPAGAIYAKARNADGTPAGGLTFGVGELKRAPGRDPSGPLDSGSDGFSSEAPRKWVSGPLPLGGTYQVYAWRGNLFCVSKPVKLTETKPDAELELQFAQGKTFEGVALGADGKPLADVEVNISFTLTLNHGFSLKSVLTDGQGRFQLENAAPEAGEYTAQVNAPGVMAERLKLVFGPQPRTFRLKRGRKLAGRVVELATGYAIPGTEVRALDYDRTDLPVLTTRADADGRFEFTSLGDANYKFFVEDGVLVSGRKFRADGNTNVTLAVKLYEWSKAKPKPGARALR